MFFVWHKEPKAVGELKCLLDLCSNPGNSTKLIYRVTENPKNTPQGHCDLPYHQRLLTHLLCIPCCLCIILIVAITVVPVKRDTDSTDFSPNRCRSRHGFLALLQEVALNSPGRSVGLPGAQTHPAEFRFAVLVPTDHVVAAPVLLDGDVAFRAFLLAGQTDSTVSRASAEPTTLWWSSQGSCGSKTPHVEWNAWFTSSLWSLRSFCKYGLKTFPKSEQLDS